MDKEKRAEIKIIINAALLIIIGFLALVLITITGKQKIEIRKLKKEIAQERSACHKKGDISNAKS
jgi:hypothetical protein